MARQTEQLRNIGVIAHIDAGKTTVTERMLFYSGAKHRVGSVDQGTTETDEDPEEQERGITIYAACVTFLWRETHINLIDTPGHVDFTAEVERCLRVLDGAVVVFSAREGVEAQSETVWRQADHYRVPRVAFINKLDREGADFQTVFDEIRERLQANPVALQMPVGIGPAHAPDPFRGVIDLIDMRMLTFDRESEGRTIRASEIPGDLREDAEIWRTSLLETLYNYSDEMMEFALQEKPIPPGVIRRVLRRCVIAHQVQPVLCGSALHGIGVQPVLDAVVEYLPSPRDLPPVDGISLDPRSPWKEVRRPDASEPFCGLVFKVLPAKTGDLSWVRVYSGELRANSRVLNPGRDKKENIAQLWQIHATKKQRDGQVDAVSTGDIVGVIGPRHSITGDTLCDPKHPVLLEKIQFPETVISMSIEPENSTERGKLADVLDMLKRQDPTLGVRVEETGQTLISGMGELHLEIVRNRLLRDFHLNVKFRKPQVSYRETIQGAAEAVGECHRQLGGQQLFAKIRLRVEPYRVEGGPVLVLNQCPFDAAPAELVSLAADELKTCGEGGGRISGSPLMNIRVTVLGAEANEHSTDVAFRIAAHDAFEKGLEAAGMVLLEPIMRLVITTPEDFLGEFVGDLRQRRAVIDKTDIRGRTVTITARAPLKELFGYSSAMRSLSQGRAGASMEPLEYAPAPAEDVRRFQGDA
ncbi:MAG: elongation factor G [Planctomycetes bacterium]|nr:elongation factor G [Planctomycetota bacterium]